MITIPQNVFYITIAFVVVLGLIIAIIQWRKVRKAQNNVHFLTNQMELKKIELVEKKQEFKSSKDEISLIQDDKDKIYTIHRETSHMLNKVNFLETEVSKKADSLKTRREYQNLEKLLFEIDKKEKSLEKHFNSKLKDGESL